MSFSVLRWKLPRTVLDMNIMCLSVSGEQILFIRVVPQILHLEYNARLQQFTPTGSEVSNHQLCHLLLYLMDFILLSVTLSILQHTIICICSCKTKLHYKYTGCHSTCLVLYQNSRQVTFSSKTCVDLYIHNHEHRMCFPDCKGP